MNWSRDSDLLVFDTVTHGFTLVYQPAAIVHHWHRRDYGGLRRTVYGYGVGLTAFLTRVVLREPRRLPELLAALPGGLIHMLDQRSSKNERKGSRYPRELTWLERAGMLRGPWAYLQGRRELRRAERGVALRSTADQVTEEPGRADGSQEARS